ncbi:MAG: hypothetical protein M0D53_01850 [Flavobacterium sp. JAD_PAG50586_2]|nr:MAG: hypothetical protein M0D53_01850 [Flavobacterium sp. JAD_PAG50586_2]
MNKTDTLILEKVLIFCFAFFILQFIVRYIKTQLSKRKGREILKLLTKEELKKIDVRISETRYSPYSNRGGTLGFLNSTLFYSENILVFTQNEKFNFEELNYTIPFVVRPNDVKDFVIKSDEYILRIGNSRSGKEIQIYSEKENDLLNVIINNFKNRSHNKELCLKTNKN